MRPCASESLLLGHCQRPLNKSTKNGTCCRSCSQSLGLGLLTSRLYHALERPVQGRVCNDRRGGGSCSRRGAIEDAWLARDLEPVNDLTTRGAHTLERAPNGRME